MMRFATLVLIGLLMPLPSWAQQQTISAECTTKKTGLDGIRHSCDTQSDTIRAPADHVFNQNSLQGGETSGAGSTHYCEPVFGDFVEVIPETGIVQPTSLTLSAHARGPKRHLGGRGWVKCSYTVHLVKYR